MRSYFRILSLFLTGRRPEARSQALKNYQRMLKRYYSLRPPKRFNVMTERWDYLIILDACRYDFFDEQYRKFLEGTLEKRITMGTSTSDWLFKTFDRYYGDTVYVSSNPHCSDHEIHNFLGTRHFHAIEHVWKYAWNDKLDTVTPDKVSAAALKMRQEHPDKRMIIHYIQPHGPWIGKTRISTEEVEVDPDRKQGFEGKWTVDSQVWEFCRQGRFDMNKLIQADKDNLELVLEDVKKLVSKLSGRIIVTADHGEGFGEKFIYGHPPGIYTQELAEVPWLIIDKGERKVEQETVSEESTNTEVEMDEEVLKQRLRALGYMD